MNSIDEEIDRSGAAPCLELTMRRRCGLHKDENRILSADFHVLEVSAGEAVNVQAEDVSIIAREGYITDIQAFAIVIKNFKIKRRSGFVGVDGAHFQSIDREGRAVGRRSSDAVLDAARKGKHRDKNRYKYV